MTLHLICLGKLKESYWREAEAEYTKRLKPFVRLEIHELKEESFTEKDARELVKQKEAEKITSVLEKIKDAFVIVLDERGAEYSSIDFAKKLSGWSNDHSNIVFIMGGPLGLSAELLTRATTKIALSRYTFTHQMARIILVEQVYRSYMILNGRSYHY
jgi:23S rRNA (pseudouridine1915-N3)-methyltransferase